MKGPFTVDLEYIDRNIPSDDCEMILSFKRSRLLVALTLLPASVLFETGNPVRWDQPAA